MDLDKILKVAIRGGASDVIFKVNEKPRFRFRGDLVTLSDGDLVARELIEAWILKITPDHLKSQVASKGDADFAYQATSGHRFRVNTFRQRQQPGIVMRVVSSQVKSIEELQLPHILNDFTKEKRGLVLVTGATGSGKSTTLAAMIQKINEEKAAHIITIEDPIEFLFKDEKSTINQREIGIDTDSFGVALRAALRQNPDVILVGELRDKETTECALMAAETGHLVFSTLHTSDAVETLTRLLSYFPQHAHETIRQMLSHALKAVVSQRLVARMDGKGMVAAHEIMVSSANVRSYIEKGTNMAALHTVIANGQDTYGMRTFDDSLLELFNKGMISQGEALNQASNRNDMLLKIRGVGA